MPLLFKRKKKAKNQARDIEGQYNTKKMELTDQEDIVNELYNSDTEDKLDVSIKNGGEENGGWNKYNELDVSDLEWEDEDDTAVGTKKITSFFTSSQPLDLNDLEEISDNSDSEPDSYTLMINRKANDLK
ncbi:5078_t:CDS:2, partial [Dentiscutata heterogama]